MNRPVIPSLNMDAMSKYGMLSPKGSDQAWREKQLLDVLRVGQALGDFVEEEKKLKIHLMERYWRDSSHRGVAAAGVRERQGLREAEAKRMASAAGQKIGPGFGKGAGMDGLKDNWGSAAGVGAAALDTVATVATTAKDAFGKAITIGVAGEVGGIVTTGVDLLRLARSGPHEYVMNPRFVQNGHDDHESPRTRMYFNVRRAKKIGGTLTSALGSAASAYTAVNTLGLLRHGRAVANTTVHLIQLGRELAKWKESDHLKKLINVVIAAKSLKLVNRGGALAADAIPGVALASSLVSGITGIPTSIAMMSLDKLMTFASIELHWRAFVERRLSSGLFAAAKHPGHGGGSGPAMRIVTNLYVGAVSEHHWSIGVRPHEFINEPCGWMVIKDKMSLL